MSDKKPTREEMYDQVVKQLTNMDENEIKKMANNVVNLAMELRNYELKRKKQA